MSDFSHLDPQQRPRMVDVTEKKVTRRTALAVATVRLPPAALERFDGQDVHSPKGPIFHTAILAGIQAAKKTSDLIPLCHPLPLTKCSIEIEPAEQNRVRIRAAVTTDGKTGVEMEALTAASVAALTLYDMCKAIDKGIVIEEVKLLEKTGGKSGDFRAS